MSKEAGVVKAFIEKIHVKEDATEALNEQAVFAALDDGESDNLTIKVLIILGGILATLFFLVFLFLTGIYEHRIGMLVLGLIMVGVSTLVNRQYNKVIVGTISVSSYLIGFVFIGISLIELDKSEDFVSLTVFLLAVLSLLVTPGYLLSFVAVLMVNGSLLTLLMNEYREHYILVLIPLQAWLLALWYYNEAGILTARNLLSRIYYPVRTGMVFALVMTLIFIGKRGLLPFSHAYYWLTSISIFGTIFYVLHNLFETLDVRSLKRKWSIYAVVICVLLPTIYAPAISSSFLLILLAFHVNHKTGAAVGIVGLIYFISQYYYDLEFTLLTKSVVLFTSGVLFLLFFYFLNKKIDWK